MYISSFLYANSLFLLCLNYANLGDFKINCINSELTNNINKVKVVGDKVKIESSYMNQDNGLNTDPNEIPPSRPDSFVSDHKTIKDIPDCDLILPEQVITLQLSPVSDIDKDISGLPNPPKDINSLEEKLKNLKSNIETNQEMFNHRRGQIESGLLGRSNKVLELQSQKSK